MNGSDDDDGEMFSEHDLVRRFERSPKLEKVLYSLALPAAFDNVFWDFWDSRRKYGRQLATGALFHDEIEALEKLDESIRIRLQRARNSAADCVLILRESTARIQSLLEREPVEAPPSSEPVMLSYDTVSDRPTKTKHVSPLWRPPRKNAKATNVPIPRIVIRRSKAEALDKRVERILALNPAGLSLTSLLAKVGGTKALLRNALERLQSASIVVHAGNGKNSRYLHSNHSGRIAPIKPGSKE